MVELVAVGVAALFIGFMAGVLVGFNEGVAVCNSELETLNERLDELTDRDEQGRFK